MSLPQQLLSSLPRPRTHNALNDFYQESYLAAVRKGDQEPFVWPYNSFGSFILIAYLLLPPTKSKVVHYAFYPVFAFFAYWCFKAIFETKSGSMAVSYVMGIINAWAVLWIAVRVIFTDFRFAMRVERRLVPKPKAADGLEIEIGTTSGLQKQDSSAKARHGKDKLNDITQNDRATTYEYYWQTLPSKFLERVDFVTDLLFSMRGPGWAHQARSIPGPPQHVADQLDPPPPTTKSVVRAYKDESSLLYVNIIRLLNFMIYLDIIKTIMSHDEYFLGFVDPPAPGPSFLPGFVRDSAVLTRWYRLILSMFGTRIALGTIFTLSPLFFSGILGSRIMGIRAEPWYYSDFGGDWRYLLSDGIAGWWGTWWHQIFRLGFEAPSKWFCQKVGWSPKSPQGKIIGVIMAFTCSGLLHGLASVATLPETKPWSGALCFFLLQALGTIVEDVAGQLFRKAGVTQNLPKVVRQATTVIWLATWIYYTGPIIIDDFSRSGVWLFEPVPFSILAMLGFREQNDHWWRWRARNVFWHTGDRWWKSGLAV